MHDLHIFSKPTINHTMELVEPSLENQAISTFTKCNVIHTPTPVFFETKSNVVGLA